MVVTVATICLQWPLKHKKADAPPRALTLWSQIIFSPSWLCSQQLETGDVGIIIITQAVKPELTTHSILPPSRVELKA